MEQEAKVKSLYKAVKLLECFGAETPELGITELAERTGMVKSSVHNIVSTYEKCGMLEKNLNTGKYRLGFMCYRLGNLYYALHGGLRGMQPVLEGLAKQANECVYLATPKDNAMIYVECVRRNRLAENPAAVGELAPMHCTGVGKCMLAFMPVEQAERVISAGLVRFTQNTITDPAKLRAEIAEVKRRGYATDNMERELGIACVAVPVRNRRGEAVAAISVSGPSPRFTRRRIAYLAGLLQSAAEKLGILLEMA